MAPCKHSKLTITSSAATTDSYIPFAQHQLYTAETGKRKLQPPSPTSGNYVSPADFPAPLALPGDALREDPKYPAQSFQSWLNLARAHGGRNEVTARAGVVYVAAPPEFGEMDEWMEEGTRCRSGKGKADKLQEEIAPPAVNEIITYLRAFYHGVEVRRLPDQLTWVPWEETGSPEIKRRTHVLPEHIGLQTRNEIIRVRIRHNPVSISAKNATEARNLFKFQLNQLDLLDVAEAVLPADAHTLLLVTNHDLYEDEDDDFCCGRAFGASRIAVVSTARYSPVLDVVQGVERQHVWPASHCAQFVDRLCRDSQETERKKKKPKRMIADNSNNSGPTSGGLHAAVSAQLSTAFDPATTYLLRASRTASHEIGHCFGLDHCMYYACAMQGTCWLPEDNRQPPYLCPVCERKVGWAVTSASARETGKGTESVDGADEWMKTWRRDRYEAILGVCEQFSGAFAPLAAWTEARLGKI